MLCSGLVGEMDDGLGSENFEFGRKGVEFRDKGLLYVWNMREYINISRK